MSKLFNGRILLLLIFVLGAGILYSVNINVGYLNRINSLQSELAVQTKQKDEMEKKLLETEKSLQSQIKAIRNNLEIAEGKLRNMQQLKISEIEKLKEKGLQDPEKDLKQDLLKHNELIPYKPVLGGTMNIGSEESIQIISSEWAAAYFTDGHIDGIMLLRYNVLKDGRIRWYVIDSFLY